MLAVTGRMAYLLRIWLITSDFLGSNPNSVIQLSCSLVNYCSQMFFFLTVKGLSFPTWLALGLATWHALANKMQTGISFHIWIEMLRSTAYWVTDHFFFFFFLLLPWKHHAPDRGCSSVHGTTWVRVRVTLWRMSHIRKK